MSPEKQKQLDDFEGDEVLASEYSVQRTCNKSDSGYHCNHYDEGGSFGFECCICEETNPEFAAKKP
jgi:hypothetical protein